MTTSIIWLRQDLRLADNPALAAACKNSDNVVIVYILDDKTPGAWKMGGASRWWLHHSLAALSKDLNTHKTTLTLRSGTPKKIIEELIKSTGATAVYWNRCYEPYAIERDKDIKSSLQKQNVKCETFNGSLLIEPWEVQPKTAPYYRVFTPFWNTCLKVLAPERPLPTPKIPPSPKVTSDNLSSWNLLPEHPDWSDGLKKNWIPGEKEALKKLQHFLNEGIENYSIGRDLPAESLTSSISPHLHFGEISPKQIWCQINEWTAQHPKLRGHESISRYLTEIGWREFSYHLLYHFPQLPNEPFDGRFKKFPWQNNPNLLKQWQKGLTGYPIVDAGMRQLWETGWMHNRVRMVVASFLTKHLLVNWQQGASWFWDTLVDADLASNSASWQWVAGCGADAAPFFRIFNPILQGEKFDPEGTYVKRWCPELKNVPAKWVHNPWEAPEEILKAAKIKLGVDYPKPIVDHREARERALKAFKQI